MTFTNVQFWQSHVLQQILWPSPTSCLTLDLRSCDLKCGRSPEYIKQDVSCYITTLKNNLILYTWKPSSNKNIFMIPHSSNVQWHHNKQTTSGDEQSLERTERSICIFQVGEPSVCVFVCGCVCVRVCVCVSVFVCASEHTGRKKGRNWHRNQS